MAAWDQLPGESAEDYARFLYYRNIGPNRSFRKAYKLWLEENDGYRGGLKGLHFPGNWQRASMDYKWTSRAALWDVHNIETHGAEIAALHAETIRVLAGKNLSHVKMMKPGQKGYSALISAVETVQKFLTPELVNDVKKQGEPASPAPDPVPVGGEADEQAV